MLASLLELLFPRGCCACGVRPVGGTFCRSCASLVEVPPIWRCHRCAGPVPPPADRGEAAAPAVCPACIAHPPAFRHLAAPFVYGGSIADSIHRLKYRGRREVARPLAALVAGSCARALSSVDLVAPIPLHAARCRERGFDQAALLAREIARMAGKPLRRSLLVRIRDTPRQVGLSRSDRSENLKGAFRMGESAEGLSVILVDDVVTTGATASAAAETLARAGCANVVVLAIARAM